MNTMNLLNTIWASIGQFFANGLEGYMVHGAVAGIGLGIIVGLIVWPTVKEPDSSIRIFIGGAAGTIIQSIIEAVRVGQTVAQALRDGIGSSITQADFILSFHFINSFSHVLLATAVGAAIIAFYLSAQRAVTGALLGIGVGAATGLAVALTLASWQLPITGFVFESLVVILATAVFWIVLARR